MSACRKINKNLLSIYALLTLHTKADHIILSSYFHNTHFQDVMIYHGHTRYTYLHLLVMLVTREDQEKCLPIVYQLSNAGADLNAADATGATPLQMAIDKGLIHFMVRHRLTQYAS